MVGIVSRAKRSSVFKLLEPFAAEPASRIVAYRVKDSGASRKRYWLIEEKIVAHRVKDSGASRKYLLDKSCICRKIVVSIRDAYVFMLLFLMYVDCREDE